MNNINNTENIVREVLIEDIKARNDDKWLILQVLRKLGINIYIDYEQLKDMPSFETITRCRRKIQNTDGELRASKAVEQLRERQIQPMKDYARSSGSIYGGAY